MSKVIVKIDGKEVNEPNNIQELEIELNFDNTKVTSQLSLTSFEFGVGDNRKGNDAYTFIKQRLNSVQGVIEGVPLQLELDNQKGTTFNLFDGYIDLWSAKYSNGTVQANAIQKANIDWLEDVADSISFEYLESLGKITSSNYIQVPYCINRQNNGIEIIISILSVYTVSTTLKEQLTNLLEKSAKAPNPFEATVIATTIVRVLYISTLIIALLKLLIDIFNYLVQPVKYHATMKVVDMFEIGLSHFGLKLKSSILQQYPYNQMVIMPRYNNLYSKNNITGLLGNFSRNNDDKGYYQGTFGELVRAIKSIFKAKIIIQDGVFYFEPNNFTTSSPKFQLPDLLNNKYEFELNKEDFVSNYEIAFQTDLQDKNTIQEWTGTSVQLIQTPISFKDQQLVLSKGFDLVQIPFALGKKKTELSFIESVLDAGFKVIGEILNALISALNELIKIINAVIKIINGIVKTLKTLGIKIKFVIKPIPSIPKSNIKNLIENRIGMLKMESDFVSTEKLLIVGSNGKLLPENSTHLNARYLFENYHFYVSFVASGNFKGNQYLLKSFEQIPFNVNDYEKVRLNNKIYDGQGNEAEILTLKYNPLKETASGTYRVNYTYLKNIKQTILEPNG